MACPKCSHEFEVKTFQGVTVERCTGCFGLFCTPEAIEIGRETWRAEAFLDFGHDATGKVNDSIDEIDCPECQVRMDKISDPEQPHIWMEACPQCFKVFLDAGEFTDLKFKTFADKFRTWRKGKRA
jgi:Zn-finger nucleic acid-binding protein